jgi:hypothetical protein
MTPVPLRRLRTPLIALALALLLAACAPQAISPAFSSPEGETVERIARIAFHRMEIGLLEVGNYTTNVLVDLDLPSGVRWIVTDFSSDGYALRFTSDTLPQVAWLVSPRGVQRTLTN